MHKKEIQAGNWQKEYTNNKSYKNK